MGTELERGGVKLNTPIWSAEPIFNYEKKIMQIYTDYIRVGCDLLTTNTFRTNPRTFRKIGKEKKARIYTEKAINLCHQMKKTANKDLIIAGSIAPVEDCYSPNLVPTDEELLVEHETFAKWLYEADIDVFLIETMNTIRETKIATDVCREYNIPIISSIIANKNGDLLSGEPFKQLISKLSNKYDVLSVNCSSFEATNMIIKNDISKSKSFGFYPNFDIYDEENKIWRKRDINLNWLSYYKKWMTKKPKLIGGCCGSVPDDIQHIANLIEQY